MKIHISGLTEILFRVLSKEFRPNYWRWFKEHRSWGKKLTSIQLTIYCKIFEVTDSCI